MLEEVSWEMDGSPRIGGGGVAFQGSVDAFLPVSRGGWEGLLLGAAAAHQGRGGVVLGGNQNWEVAMATTPDTSKQEMPLYLLCLDEAQRGPGRPSSATAPAFLT